MCLPSASAAAVGAAPRAGWAWYHDTHIGYQVPIPPGWQPAAYTDTPPDGSPSSFTVQFFSPNSPSPLDPGPGAAAMESRLITISAMPAGVYPSVSRDPVWCREPSPVVVGSGQVSLYQRDFSIDLGLLRAAEIGFRGYILLLEMKENALPPAQVVDPATVRNDTALFLAMLQGFGPLAG